MKLAVDCEIVLNFCYFLMGIKNWILKNLNGSPGEKTIIIAFAAF